MGFRDPTPKLNSPPTNQSLLGQGTETGPQYRSAIVRIAPVSRRLAWVTTFGRVRAARRSRVQSAVVMRKEVSEVIWTHRWANTGIDLWPHLDSNSRQWIITIQINNNSTLLVTKVQIWFSRAWVFKPRTQLTKLLTRLSSDWASNRISKLTWQYSLRFQAQGIRRT